VDRIELTEAEAWAEIERLTVPKGARPGDISAPMYAERFGVSETTARRRLKAAVARGEMEMLPDMALNGRRCTVYRIKRNGTEA
jgi:predicted ArsR family transcriptional regulator